MNNVQNRLVLAALLLGGMAISAYAMPEELYWITVDGGGDTSAGGGFALSGTIGQPDAGTELTGGGFRLVGGYWAGVAGPGGALPGDCNADGSVNLEDYIRFEACLLGPGLGLGRDCECADLDEDGSVTVLDFAEFQVMFTGN